MDPAMWNLKVSFDPTGQWYFHGGESRYHYYGGIIVCNIPSLGTPLVTTKLTFLAEVFNIREVE